MGFLDEAIEPQQPSGMLDEALGFARPEPTQTQGSPFEAGTEANIRFKERQKGLTIKLGRGMKTIGEEVGQFSLDIIESAGLLDPGTADHFKAMSVKERREFEESFKRDFGDKIIFEIAELGGEIVPLLAIPGGPTKTVTKQIGKTVTKQLASTATKRIGVATGIGAGFGTVLSSEGETIEERMKSRISGAKFGGALGFLSSGAIEIFPAVQNFFRRKFARDVAAATRTEQVLSETARKGVILPEDVQAAIVAKEQGRAFVERGLEVSRRTGVKFKLSQLSPDPGIESLEQFARSGPRGERAARAIENAQPKQVLKFFKRTAKRLDKFDGDFGTRVEQVFKTTMGDSQKGTGMLGKRATQAASDFAKAERQVSAIPLKKTFNTIDDMVERLSGKGTGTASKALSKQLEGLKKELELGTVTPKEMQNLLETWGRASKGTGRLFKDIDQAAERLPAKRLFNSLNDDLDDAINLSDKGAALLRKARDNYRINSSAIDEIEDTALGSLFGKGRTASLEEIEGAFLRMKPSQLKTTMNILEQSDSNIHQGLQRFWLERNLKRAMVSGQADITQFVPGMMLDMVKGANRDTFKAVFNNASSRRQMMDGIEAVRRIMLNNQRTGGRTLPKVKELAGVLASRDKTFVARLSADLFAPDLVTKYLFDPRGVKALQMISPPSNQNRVAAGLAILSDIINRDEAVSEQDETTASKINIAPGI